ncbi:MAG: tail fiber domain-containing protein [Luminiphilus sp.]|nr:tail fiber domain-containing protein [Luminiphilus sp.]
MQPVVNYDHKTIQVRRGSTTEWRRYGAICVPAEGEICVEFFQDADGSRNGNTGMKVGNGTSNYTDLPYLITNQNQDDRISDDQINNWDLTVEKLANLVASEVGQTNPALGDNVQVALDDLHSRLLAIDPDGGSIEINDIPGLEGALDGKADQSALEKEIQDRKDGDQDLQDQIDALDPDGDLTVDWSEIEGKPTEFPPADHDQGWGTITGKPAEYPPSSHGHAWGEITGTPSKYPPEDHTHDQYALAKDLEDESKARVEGDAALASDIVDLEAAVGIAVGQLAFGGSYNASTGLIDKANLSSLEAGQPLPDSSTVVGTFVIVAVAGDNPEPLDEADWLVAGDSAWVAIKYGTAGSVLWDNVVGAPDFLTDAQGSIDGDSKQYVRKNSAWVEANGDSPWEENGNDIYYDDGFVGVGTNEPKQKMHIQDGKLEVRNSTGPAVISLVESEQGLGFCSAEISVTASGNNRADLTFYTKQGNSGLLPRMVIDSNGLVGIGVDDPLKRLHVDSAILSNPVSFANNQDKAYLIAGAANWDGSTTNWGTFGYQHKIKTNSSGSSRITIDTYAGEMWSMGSLGKTTFAGPVGIGMTPATFDLTAKEQLSEWKTSFDARLKAEPKADKKAVTLEITDDAFEVMPTEEALAEWMDTRAAGDALQVDGNIIASGKLQVGDTNSSEDARISMAGPANSMSTFQGGRRSIGFKFANPDGTLMTISSDGDISASGTVSAGKEIYTDFYIHTNAWRSKDQSVGLFMGGSSSSINPINYRDGGANGTSDNEINLGTPSLRFASAHFGGTVYASTINGSVTDVPAHVKAITPTQIANWDSGTGGGGGATTDGRISDTQIIHWDQAYSWGNHASAGYQPAGSYLTPSSLNGYATESWVNSQGFAKGSFVPTSGNTEINGTLTATDFIAKSDERLKDSITPMPVGLIDDIKPVSWNWKDGSGKSAGVVAQQLQAIGLDDYVHEDDDGQLGVNYQALTAILLAEVIDLKRRLAE